MLWTFRLYPVKEQAISKLNSLKFLDQDPIFHAKEDRILEPPQSIFQTFELMRVWTLPEHPCCGAAFGFVDHGPSAEEHIYIVTF